MNSRTYILMLMTAGTVASGCVDQRTTRPDVYGHRGCRGLYPENTIKGFLAAAELGADMLELDVVVTADGEVVISHEPWMRAALCLTPDGDSIDVANEKEFNIYRMKYADVKLWDCGSRPQPDFPDQQQFVSRKPRLVDMIEKIEEDIIMYGLHPVGYNIEVKSEPEWYGLFQPEPGRYAELIQAALDKVSIDERCIIQCFDPAFLNAFRKLNTDVEAALLVDNDLSVDQNLARINFVPEYYSPEKDLVTDALIHEAHKHDMEVLAWTANEPADITRLLDLGVDGIISDFPDRVVKMLEER